MATDWRGISAGSNQKSRRLFERVGVRTLSTADLAVPVGRCPSSPVRPSIGGSASAISAIAASRVQPLSRMMRTRSAILLSRSSFCALRGRGQLPAAMPKVHRCNVSGIGSRRSMSTFKSRCNRPSPPLGKRPVRVGREQSIPPGVVGQICIALFWVDAIPYVGKIVQIRSTVLGVYYGPDKCAPFVIG